MNPPRLPPPDARAARRSQQGNALLIVLVLLLVMTLLALASLRIGRLEERMTANLFDRGLAFQAAEAALRQGEVRAMTAPKPPEEGCKEGVCALPAVGQERVLGNDGWVNAAPLKDNTLAVPKAEHLQYLIEYMGEYSNTPMCEAVQGSNGQPKDPLCHARSYRVSARYRADGRAEVLLQSTITMPSPQGAP